MGTNTAAMSVHMEDPEMMNRFSNEHSRMKPMITGKPVTPAFSRAVAPLTAIQEPIPDQLNRAMNCPSTNASTRNEVMSFSAASDGREPS